MISGSVFLFYVLGVGSFEASEITSLNVWPKSVFPLELGESATWLFTPKGGAEYNIDSAIAFNLEGNPSTSYRVQKSRCVGPLEKYFTCTFKPQNEISVSFTPPEEFYGKKIVIAYYKDVESLWDNAPVILSEEVIQITKQPTYVNMEMLVKETSRFANAVPTGLRLEPPVFLTGSIVLIDCSTDGALPPVPITFSVECPPPSIAVVEHDRVTQAKQSVPYEKFYRTYGFRSPPTLSDLAPYVARKHASQLLQLGHVSSKDNKTLRARLSVNEKAHDCHVVCRIAGKETRRRLTVYHPTTISYLLPHPREGHMQVGSEITCYADGHPPPMISLRLMQPLRPPKPLSEEELEALRQVGRLPKLNGEDPVSRELILANSGLELIPQVNRPINQATNGDPSIASSGTLHQVPAESSSRWFTGSEMKEPYEEARRIPGIGLSTLERHRHLGLHPNEYSIQGATFRLAPNATPGVELLLTCSARNVLPGDTTFLGLNGTITRTRFVVSAMSYASLGISVGVCACVLLILLMIIAAMILQKRRQTRSSSDTERLTPNGMKKAKPVPKPIYTKGQQFSRPITVTSASPLTANQTHMVTDSDNRVPGPSVNNMFTNDPTYQYDAVYDPPHPMLLSRTGGSLSHSGPQELQYVELSFDRPRPGTEIPTYGPSTSLRGGPTSASMTLFATTPRSHYASRPGGASLPQGLDIAGDGDPRPDFRSHILPDDTTSHYTEIVAVMQPKAHSSQLVLQQQQEATQALLSMQQIKPRVFV